MNVVLFKVNHLGDNVVFLPVVQTLRRLRPEWKISVITAAHEQPLYLGPLAESEIWTSRDRLDFHHSWRRPWRFLHWLRRIRRARPDACLLSYDQSNAAHLLAKFSGAPVRLGVATPFLKVPGSLTESVARPASRKIVDWNWEMGRRLLAALDPSAAWPASPPPPDLTHLAPPALRHPRLVVIHAGARADIRRWGADKMLAVGRGLAATGHDVVWVERPDTPLPSGPAPRPRTVSPASLAEFCTLLRSASLLLCNNSGPVHLASALGTPAVLVSGPTSTDWDPYWHADRIRVLRMPGLACLGCEDSARGVDTCANLSQPVICMQYWPIEAVASACREVLDRSGGQLP